VLISGTGWELIPGDFGTIWIGEKGHKAQNGIMFPGLENPERGPGL